MFEKRMIRQFLQCLERIECGTATVTTPEGCSYSFSGELPGPHASLHIRDYRMLTALACRGDIGFAEAYRDGWCDSDDLTSLFLVALLNERAFDGYIYGGLFGRILSRMAYLFTRNTLSGSRKNIHAHYDLGNDFYALWLDPTMTYSAALFTPGNDNLSEAQHRKYDRITNRLRSSGSLLEVGCGWGGFAERALERGDYGIKGLTISQAQHDYATRRLGKRADIALEDYRLQEGRYDNIVSIEMFEAVGEQFWATYFSKLKSLLAEKGKAVVQTITIGDPYFDRYRTSGDPIRSFIFPGGMLPSPSRFEAESGKAGLRVTDRFAFGQDYARTMEHWLERFEQRLGDVRALGFDERFIRLWRFYLTSCIASFRSGRTNVMQMELQHAA